MRCDRDIRRDPPKPRGAGTGEVRALRCGWQPAARRLALFALLVGAVVLGGCQATLDARTPESALLTLPEDHDPLRPSPEDADPFPAAPSPAEPSPAEAGPGEVGPASTEGDTPPVPPPPRWDPNEDQVVRIGPDGRRRVEPLNPTDTPGAAAGVTPAPSQPPPTDPWLPGGAPADMPPADVPPADVPPADVPPADRPPQGMPPGVADRPAPTPPPAGGDPWLPGGTPAPTPPVPADGPPSAPAQADPDLPPAGASAPPRDLPGSPHPGRANAADPQPADAPAPPPARPPQATDDLGPPPGGASAAPFPGASTPAPRTPGTPTPVRPASAQPPAAAPASADLERRVLEHVTRLRDRPGAADVAGYPSDLLHPDDPGMALTPGSRPALVVFYDDASRASDTQAARLLPVIARLRGHIVFVALDRGASAQHSHGGDELARRYLDHVPTTAVLDGARKTRLYRPGLVEPETVERVLRDLLGLQPAPTQPTPTQPTPTQPTPTDPWLPGGTPAPTQPPPTQPAPAQPAPTDPWLPGGTPAPTQPAPTQPAPTPPPSGSDPWLPGGTPAPTQPPSGSDPWMPGGTPAPTQPSPTQPGPTQPARPGPTDPDLPPAGAPPRDPFEDLPPTAAPERPRVPADDRPPAEAPTPPSEAPTGADEGPGAERGGMTFSTPDMLRAKAHATRLRSAPGDGGVAGYPADLVTSAPADRVLATGLKPCVILFYDDGSKASDLQAAEFLTLLVRRRQEVDVVLVDVGPKARWDESQKRVVRTYYNFYVPTTVVLAPNRAPIKSWYSRIKAQDLERAIDRALGR